MFRMSPMGILVEHWRGLSDHRNESNGRPDWSTRVTLLVVPALSGIGAGLLDWTIRPASSNLVAAGALVAALLVAIFVQVATWRTRLDDRAFTHAIDEAATRRAVDATAAHSLAGALLSVLVTGIAAIAGAIGDNRVLTGIAVAVGAYLALLMLIIFHMAFVAYESVSDPAIKDSDDKLLSRQPTVEVPGRDAATR